MAGATPFFVTAAAAGADQRAGKRKRPDAVGIEQLKDELEMLAGTEDAAMPLGVRCLELKRSIMLVGLDGSL